MKALYDKRKRRNVRTTVDGKSYVVVFNNADEARKYASDNDLKSVEVIDAYGVSFPASKESA